jgi:hypothetical protein
VWDLWWTKWRWCRFYFSEYFGFLSGNLHSICFSAIIFTITRGWHNRPGVAAVPIASDEMDFLIYLILPAALGDSAVGIATGYGLDD